MTLLAELLTRANKDGWSTREIAERARKAGHNVGHDTVAKYLRGDHGHPNEKTLRALASAFPSLELAELRAAAGLPREITLADIPDEASRLSARQWLAIRELIMSMVENTDAVGDTLMHVIREDSLIIADLLDGGDGTGGDMQDDLQFARALKVVDDLKRRRREQHREARKAARKPGRPGSNAEAD